MEAKNSPFKYTLTLVLFSFNLNCKLHPDNNIVAMQLQTANNMSGDWLKDETFIYKGQ